MRKLLLALFIFYSIYTISVIFDLYEPKKFEILCAFSICTLSFLTGYLESGKK